MNKKNIKRNNGFVLLYVMLLSSIIFSIALGIISIALKEAKFSTSARATNEAFFASDVGAECALFYDYTKTTVSSPINAFNNNGSTISCANTTISITGPTINGNNNNLETWIFFVGKLGDSLTSCANVTLTRDTDTGETTVISKGYNNSVDTDGNSCEPSSASVERRLEVRY